MYLKLFHTSLSPFGKSQAFVVCENRDRVHIYFLLYVNIIIFSLIQGVLVSCVNGENGEI